MHTNSVHYILRSMTNYQTKNVMNYFSIQDELKYKFKYSRYRYSSLLQATGTPHCFNLSIHSNYIHCNLTYDPSQIGRQKKEKRRHRYTSHVPKVSMPSLLFNFRATYFGCSFATTCRAHRILATAAVLPRSNLNSVNQSYNVHLLYLGHLNLLRLLHTS